MELDMNHTEIVVCSKIII